MFGFTEASIFVEEGGEPQPLCVMVFNEVTLEMPVQVTITTMQTTQGMLLLKLFSAVHNVLCLDFTLESDLLVFLPESSQACTEVSAGLDGIVESQEAFDLSLRSNFLTEETASVLTVNVISRDSKSSIIFLYSDLKN